VTSPFRNPPTGQAPTEVTTVGTRAVVSTRPARAIELVQFTESSLGKPAEMARKLTDMARNAVKVARLVFASPLLRANIVRSVSFTAATAQDVPHRLGKKWEGALLVTPVGAALSYQVARVSDAIDAGTIRVTTSATLTADLMVW
jgi:hypothetical protein